MLGVGVTFLRRGKSASQAWGCHLAKRTTRWRITLLPNYHRHFSDILWCPCVFHHSNPCLELSLSCYLAQFHSFLQCHLFLEAFPEVHRLLHLYHHYVHVTMCVCVCTHSILTIIPQGKELLFTFHKWENQGIARLSNFPKATQPGSCRERIWI